MLRNGAANLEAHSQEINDLNVFPVPDGDTGLNMYMTVSGGVDASDTQKEEDTIEAMSAAVARGMLLGARGNSGVILSQLFKGLSLGLQECSEANAAQLAEAFCRGTEQAYHAVVNPVEGTILTVAREAGEYARGCLTPDTTIEEFLQNYLTQLHVSLQKTPELLPVLKQAGVVDSGAKGYLYIVEGMAMALGGEILALVRQKEEETTAQPKAVPGTFTADSELEFGYCTEFILQLQKSKVNPAEFDLQPVIDYLSKVGNSIVALKDGDIVKVHVHTMTPGLVIGFCQQFGEFVTFKMENMSVQHNELTEKTPMAAAAKKHKRFAVAAVASGEGLKTEFLELGADVIISGGQTMNPSTEDFLQAFQTLSADYILVLPNNSNIILAAQQAAESYDRADVRVIRTTSLAQGHSVLTMLDYSSDDIDSILAILEQTAQRVVSGSITYAVRDSQFEKLTIHKGDTLALKDGKIVAAERERMDAIYRLLESVEDLEEREVMTIICGMDARMEEVMQIKAYMNTHYPYTEIGVVEGQQDVYSYLFALE